MSSPRLSWKDPIIEFLAKKVLLNETKKAKKTQRVVARFWLSQGQRLYKRSFGGPHLLCLHPSRVNDLLAKLYEGICGSHARGHSLAHQAMTQGFWWLRMQRDAVEYIKRCE